MVTKVIKTEKEYQAALSRLEEIFDSKKDSKTADELELLALLIEKYEDEISPIDLPDPIEAIKFRMDQLGYKLPLGIDKTIGNKKTVLTITQMIFESVKYPKQCYWFTTLVSKKDHLKSIYKTLNNVGAATIKTIEMTQGQKISRLVAWTFLSEKQRKDWKF